MLERLSEAQKAAGAATRALAKADPAQGASPVRIAYAQLLEDRADRLARKEQHDELVVMLGEIAASLADLSGQSWSDEANAIWRRVSEPEPEPETDPLAPENVLEVDPRSSSAVAAGKDYESLWDRCMRAEAEWDRAAEERKVWLDSFENQEQRLERLEAQLAAADALAEAVTTASRCGFINHDEACPSEEDGSGLCNCLHEEIEIALAAFRSVRDSKEED